MVLIRSEVNGGTCLIEEAGWGKWDEERGVHLSEKLKSGVRGWLGTRFSPYYI